MRAKIVKGILRTAVCGLMLQFGTAVDAGDHLACYKVRDTLQRTVFDGVDLLSNNGLPALNGCVIQTPARMCCDSVDKVGVPPQPGGSTTPGTEMPGFCCYKVKCPKGVTLSRTWSDQFGTRTLTSRGGAPSLVCAPVDPCSSTFGACSSKQCGEGRVCGDTGFGFCACLPQTCTVPTACGDASAPTCDGACPSGKVCNAIDGGGCVCHAVTTACNGGTGTCSAGECGPPLFGGDPGTCVSSGGGCACAY